MKSVMSQMVSKQAISLIDLLLQGDIKLRDGMLDPSKKWNSDNDVFHSLVQTFTHLLNQNITILQSIQKELHTDCKHPKKMRDRLPNGQWYCMICNIDI